MKKALAFASLLISFSLPALAQQDDQLVVCSHPDLNVKAVLSDIQPFSVGAGGEMVDLTSGTLKIQKEGVTEIVGTIGRATSKSESYHTDQGTGMNLVWDPSGRLNVSLVSRKLNIRIHTSSGLECVDHRKDHSRRTGQR